MNRVAVRRSRLYWISLAVMGVFYIAAGLNHLVTPQFYLAVMPPYIPWPDAVILWSGIAELLGGIGVLVPLTRPMAAWGIVLMLACFLPVHVNMCLHPEAFAHIPLWAIWVRLPLQIPLMLWAWLYTRT